MEESEHELHELTGWLQSVLEEERTRVARHLHDGPIQLLTALRMDLERVTTEWSKTMPNVAMSLRGSIELVDASIRTLRHIGVALRPGILDFGLAAALECHAVEFQANSGIKCLTKIAVEDSVWSPHVATEIFRILQQTLALFERRSQTTEITVTLKHEPGGCVLDVQDNGTGARDDSSDPRSVLELRALRQRAMLIGSEFSLEAVRSVGMIASLRIPLRQASRD
jgi:signal transduction histidine kinase